MGEIILITFYLNNISKTFHIFYTYGTSQFQVAPLEVVDSHMILHSGCHTQILKSMLLK